MKMTTTSVGGTYEILAADDFVGIPVKLSADTLAGKVVTNDGNTGVLLHDVVVADNPNGTIVVAGVLDMKKIQAHLGSAYQASDYESLPATLIKRTNIGVNA